MSLEGLGLAALVGFILSRPANARASVPPPSFPPGLTPAFVAARAGRAPWFIVDDDGVLADTRRLTTWTSSRPWMTSRSASLHGFETAVARWWGPARGKPLVQPLLTSGNELKEWLDLVTRGNLDLMRSWEWDIEDDAGETFLSVWRAHFPGMRLAVNTYPSFTKTISMARVPVESVNIQMYGLGFTTDYLSSRVDDADYSLLRRVPVRITLGGHDASHRVPAGYSGRLTREELERLGRTPFGQLVRYDRVGLFSAYWWGAGDTDRDGLRRDVFGETLRPLIKAAWGLT